MVMPASSSSSSNVGPAWQESSSRRTKQSFALLQIHVDMRTVHVHIWQGRHNSACRLLLCLQLGVSASLLKKLHLLLDVLEAGSLCAPRPAKVDNFGFHEL